MWVGASQFGVALCIRRVERSRVGGRERRAGAQFLHQIRVGEEGATKGHEIALACIEIGVRPRRVITAGEDVLALEVGAQIGAERIGMRISPYGVFNGAVPDPKMDALYLRLVEELNAVGLAYIHVVDHSSMGAPEVSPELKAKIRANFKGKYILSGGYDAARANADLDAQKGDLVAFGRPFISNPDLVAKLQSGAALTPPDMSTFYTPGEKGYTDF